MMEEMFLVGLQCAFGEDDERDRHIGHRDGADIAPVQLGKALGSLEEDEVLVTSS